MYVWVCNSNNQRKKKPLIERGMKGVIEGKERKSWFNLSDILKMKKIDYKLFY